METILLYRSGNYWIVAKNHISRITAMQMNCLKIIVKKTQREHHRNDRRPSDLKQTKFLRGWRNGNSWKPRQFMETRPLDKKTAERSRITYEEVVKHVAARWEYNESAMKSS